MGLLICWCDWGWEAGRGRGGSCVAQSSSLEHLAVASLGAHTLKLPTRFPTGSSVIRLSWKIGHNHLRREFSGRVGLFWVCVCVCVCGWIFHSFYWSSFPLYHNRHQMKLFFNITFLRFISHVYLTLWTTVFLEEKLSCHLFSFHNSSCDKNWSVIKTTLTYFNFTTITTCCSQKPLLFPQKTEKLWNLPFVGTKEFKCKHF